MGVGVPLLVAQDLAMKLFKKRRFANDFAFKTTLAESRSHGNCYFHVLGVSGEVFGVDLGIWVVDNF